MLSIYTALLDTKEEKEDFELLYQTYRKLMHWVANDILQDKALAEDAVHEAFVRIIKNFHKIDNILCSETKNYVVIIVRNVALSLRKEKTHNFEESPFCCEGKYCVGEQSDDELHSILENISYGFDETTDELFKKELMSKILLLPESLKEILLLYGYFGYSIKEIAISLNISEDAAYKRLQRARNKLAKEIQSR